MIEVGYPVEQNANVEELLHDLHLFFSNSTIGMLNSESNAYGVGSISGEFIT